MSLSVGSTGALLTMIVIALWIWRRGERPIRSAPLHVALFSMILGIVLESAWPMLAMKVADFRNDGCGLWGFLVLNAAVHAVSLGAFVGFILTTIGKTEAKAEIKN